MLSTPKTAQPAADVANVQADKIASNQRAVPLPYFSGRKWLALNWGQSNVYNPQPKAVTQKVGKSKQITGYDYFGDLFGLTSPCLNDYLEAIEVAGKIVWSGSISRDVDHPHHSGDIVVPGVGTFRYYWGTPDQPADDLVLAGCGELHPRYLDQSYLVGKGVYFGNNNATPPTIRVLAERAARFDGLDENRTREGANGITAIAEVIGNDWYGLARPELIDAGTWAPFAASVRRDQAVAVPGDPDHIAAMGYISPFSDRIQAVQSFIASVLEIYDGWIRRKDDKLEVGQFPHDGVIPEDIPEFTFHDFIEAPVFDAADDSEGDVITDAIVTHVERDNNMEDDSQPGSNLAACARLGEIREKTFQRPFLVTGYQAREQANRLAVFYSRPEEKCSVTIRRERVVGLRAGDRFILNDAPSEERIVVRIVDRRDDSSGGRVALSLVAERGLAPLGYTPVPQQQPELPDPALVAIAHARMFQLPFSFGDFGPAPAVVPLVARPGAHVAGYSLHYSPDNVSYDRITAIGRWALRADFAAGIVAGDGTATINAAGFDLALLAPQSAAAQAEDTLLAICGFEIMSIGDVVALGGGQYTVALARGRRGSVAAAHAGGAEIYIAARADLDVLQHADFPREIATRHFKLATYTASRDGGEEQELADALHIAFDFDDAGVTPPSGFAAVGVTEGIELVWALPLLPNGKPDPTIAMVEGFVKPHGDPAPVPGDAPDFEVLASYKRIPLAAGTQRDCYILCRDTIGDRSVMSAVQTATALASPAIALITTETADREAADLAEALARAAAVAAEAADRLAADSAEAATRAADILAEALARGTAITTEQTTRASADSALAATDTTLTASIASNAAAISAEATTRATDDSALSSSITTVAATAASNTAAISTEAAARASGDSALSTSLTALTATVGTNTADISSESAARASADSALSTSITTLSATVGGLSSTVTILDSAFIVGGVAVATYGWKLDGGGKVVSMQAIAASGGVQNEVGVVIFGGCNVQSDDFVAGTTGWQLKKTGGIDVGTGNFRGTVDVSSGYNRTQITTGGASFGSGGNIAINGYATSTVMTVGTGGSGGLITLAGFAGYSVISFGGTYSIDSNGDADLHSVDVADAYYVGGTKVVGSRQAAITAALTNANTAIVNADFAGSDTLDLTAFVAHQNAVDARLNDHGDRINDIRAVLAAHGLTA